VAELPLQVVPENTINDMRGPIARDIIGWNDLAGPATEGAGATALTAEPYLATSFRMLFFRHDQNDSLSFTYQMSHAWEPGTIVRPHVHIIPMVNPAVTQNVFLQGQYVWGITGQPLPDVAGWTAFDVTYPITTTAALIPEVIDLTGGVGFTPPALAVESSFLLVFIQRSGTNVLDTYSTNKPGPGTAAANLAVLSFDCHFQTVKPGGSQTELHG
jgi:hypothetical protein